jgi:hypothetical protein
MINPIFSFDGHTAVTKGDFIKKNTKKQKSSKIVVVAA